MDEEGALRHDGAQLRGGPGPLWEALCRPARSVDLIQVSGTQ